MPTSPSDTTRRHSATRTCHYRSTRRRRPRAAWYALGAAVLDEVLTGLRREAAPTVAQLWPEHFDVGLDVGVADGRRANLGASPGDRAFTEPYLYIGPWSDERPGDPAFWNAEFGAMVGDQQLRAVADPVAAGVGFLRRACGSSPTRGHSLRTGLGLQSVVRLEPDGMSDPAVLLERDGPVLTITLNRPDKRNAINPEVLCRLADAWDELDGDDALLVGIVTGAGGNFSAGADLDRLVGAMIAGDPPENEFEARIRDDLPVIYKGLLKEHHPAKPIIAAVEGSCYAGGIEILQGFDVRVAAEGARIAVSEVCRGLFPMGGSTVRLPRQIPYAVAMEMLITGQPISGQRAYEVGLVGHVTPDGGTLAKAREIAATIAANGPTSGPEHQGCSASPRRVPEAQAYEREKRTGAGGHALRDAREGPKAFLEKRTPNFTGK